VNHRRGLHSWKTRHSWKTLGARPARTQRKHAKTHEHGRGAPADKFNQFLLPFNGGQTAGGAEARLMFQWGLSVLPGARAMRWAHSLSIAEPQIWHQLTPANPVSGEPVVKRVGIWNPFSLFSFLEISAAFKLVSPPL
jgi:hypothetical protein